MATASTTQYKTVETREGVQVVIQVVYLDDDAVPFDISGLIETIEDFAESLADDVQRMELS